MPYIKDIMLRLITILILAGLNLISSAQSCIPDYIDFYLQSQVDSFQINYPGCTEIEGDVYISGNDITNLIGLGVLTSIGGNLRIENTSSLTKLNGLNNISVIGEDLLIEDNESLYNFDGLSSLVQINGTLTIKENSSLVSLSGLDNLTTIGEDINIGCSGYSWTGNPLLSNLSGLNSLSSIGNSLRICRNHGLTDLSGIENLTNVENISISSNDNLSSLTGLQGISNIDGYIYIGWNDLLNSLDGLNNLTTVGSLTLFRLPNLDNLSGLEHLCTVNGDLEISSNHTIINITSLDSLIYIGGQLTIDNNYDLIDLSGFENLTEIGGGLEIINNTYLSNINALSSVTSIGGDLIIRTHPFFTSLIGLSGVTSIAGNLTISNMSQITSLSGIENISASSIENLNISWLYSLTDCVFPNICEYLADPNGVVDIFRNGNSCYDPTLIANECGITLQCLPYGNYHFQNQAQIDSFQTDYSGCTDLGGSLYIQDGFGSEAGEYTNLDGLSVITSIDGVLVISGSDSLSSLSGLDNVDATSISALYIVNNPFLSECEVESICDYLANPVGEVDISDNASGCNHPNQVQNACETVTIQEKDLEPLFSVYPIPARHYLCVDNRSRHKIDKILIYNTIGQIIFSQDYKGSMIHISELEKGVYILEIITDELKTRMKFIVRN